MGQGEDGWGGVGQGRVRMGGAGRVVSNVYVHDAAVYHCISFCACPFGCSFVIRLWRLLLATLLSPPFLKGECPCSGQ